MLVINVLGLLLVALIVWWFWLYKPKESSLSEEVITIIVENGTYHPSRIKLTAGQPSTLSLIRLDESPCANTIIFQGLDISEELSLHKATTIHLPAMKRGEYAFSCQMNMYRGTLLVE